MDVLKSLIIGWSIVWASFLFAVPLLHGPGRMSILVAAFSRNHTMMMKQIIYSGPLYVFGVWAIGCIVIIFVVQLVRRFWKK